MAADPSFKNNTTKKGWPVFRRSHADEWCDKAKDKGQKPFIFLCSRKPDPASSLKSINVDSIKMSDEELAIWKKLKSTPSGAQLSKLVEAAKKTEVAVGFGRASPYSLT